MSTTTATIDHAAYRSPYEHRLDLVTAVLRDKTDPDAAQARATAASVLNSIDTMPEHIR